MAANRNFKRRGTSRVRSGCITCKARRVKCDEMRPSCNQCVSRGLVCGGYKIQMVPYRRNALTSPRPPPAYTPHVDCTERGLFAVFVQRGRYVTHGIIDNGPLHILLCQAAHREPGIWHGIIALEAGTKGSRDTALVQHGKMLKILRNGLRNSRQPASILVLLLLCLLCVPFELMHRGEQAAKFHLDGAMAVLGLLDEDDGLPRSNYPRVQLRRLQEAFEELQCQYSLRMPDGRHTMTPLNARLSKEQHSQTCLETSAHSHTVVRSPIGGRSALDELSDYDVQSLQHFDAYRRFAILAARSVLELQAQIYKTGSNLDFFVAQKQISHLLSLWSSAMQRHLSQPLTPQQQKRLREYSMFHYQAKIAASTMQFSGSSDHNIAYKEHLADFERIVDLAKTAVLIRPIVREELNPEQADFGLHVGAIQPLHFTATKRPDPRIRCDALQLLQGPYARREGWWSGKHAASSALLASKQD